MESVSTQLRVRYAETDQMGVVYHANYIIWMEVGRVEYFRAQGIRYRDMEQEGILLVVVEAHCRYHSPARYDEEVSIRTWVEEAGPRMIRFGYEMTDIAHGPASGHRRNQAHLLRPRPKTQKTPRKIPCRIWNTLVAYALMRAASTLVCAAN